VKFAPSCDGCERCDECRPVCPVEGCGLTADVCPLLCDCGEAHALDGYVTCETCHAAVDDGSDVRAEVAA
jgi:hypothetical protein